MPDTKKSDDLEAKLQHADPKREERDASEERAERAPEPAKAVVAGTPIGEASDPAVLQLLAEAETARLNGNEERKEAFHDEIRKLGYEVS